MKYILMIYHNEAKLQFDVEPLTGEALQVLVAELAATPREIVARVRSALEAPSGP